MTTPQEAQSPPPSPNRDSATVLGLNNVDKQLDLIQRLMERGNAFISHPLASGTIDQTEEAGELLREAAEALTGLAGENAALKREAHTWSKAAETYAADAERLRSMAAPTVKDSLTVAAGEREAFDHSIGEGRLSAEAAEQDAARFRMLLQQNKHWLGVFACNPDGTPSDSLDHAELTARLDALIAQEPAPEQPKD